MQITKTRTFTVEKELKKPITFKWLNALGGWDTMQFTRYKATELKVSPVTFAAKTSNIVSTINAVTTITYYSPLLTEAHYYWLADLKLSPRILVDNKLMNIVNDSFKYDNYGDGFYVLEITLTPASDKKSIKV